MLSQKEKNNLTEKVLKIAMSNLRVQETPIGSNITKFNIWFYGSAVRAAWCYIFVCYCLAMAGIKIIKCAYVPTGFEYYRRRNLISKKGMRGNLVFMSWRSDRIPEHIGFLLKDLGNGYYLTIEGNTSPSNKHGSQANGDGVYEKTRHISEIVGFADWTGLL